MPDTRTIALSCIVVAKRRLRALREETVNALVQSMAVQGQLQPIIVRRDTGGGYWLVAGLHRFDAAQKLKWGEINCTVFDDMDADQAELAEIDENLIRADLTPAEEAVHIGRRKELYEKVHPETMHGAVGRRGKRSQNATSFEPVDAFIDDTAKKTGKHRATIARKAARAKKVPVLPDIVGTSLDEGAQIDALAKLPVEKQRSLAEAAKRGEQVSAISARNACDAEALKISDGTQDIEFTIQNLDRLARFKGRTIDPEAVWVCEQLELGWHALRSQTLSGHSSPSCDTDVKANCSTIIKEPTKPRKTNALTHGIYGKDILLPWESRDDFEKLLADLREEFRPDGLMENEIIFDVAHFRWQKYRVRQMYVAAAYGDPFVSDLVRARQKSWVGLLRHVRKNSRICTPCPN
jgi:ParB-like chromosome segregation protein Spo0J